MLYTQYLFSSGADIQLLVIPRPEPVSRSIRDDQSSFAGKFHVFSEALEADLDLMLAHHFGENLGALSFTRGVLEGIWRTDMSFTRLESDETVVSLTTNLDRSWVLFGKNLYAFIEYFYSGVGVSDGNYTDLDLDLTDRILRSELFTLGRDYLTLGSQLEWSPRLNMFFNHIFNLHDESDLSWLERVHILRAN